MSFLHRAWAEIDTSALLHNFNIIKSNSNGAKIMAVVKADAYGHSVRDIAPVLDAAGADSFAVSNIEEAIELRSVGIDKPILVLGYTPCDMANTLAKYDISQCVYSLEYARALSENAVANGVRIKVHIKLDTGMGRLGFDCRSDELLEIDDALLSAGFDNFILEGIFTHFAESDRQAPSPSDFTNEQFFRFKAAIKAFEDKGFKPQFCHCSNSGAFCQDNDKQLDMCRAGIILYGLTPSADMDLKLDFKPVMTFKSVVSFVKEISADTCVSYGRTFKAPHNMRIATVSAGYADGYPRTLSNKGFVLIGGKRANIVGRVCMDQLCVDVTDIDGVKMGDEVTLFGSDLPVEELASLAGTINYEIVCGISPRVPRIIIK